MPEEFVPTLDDLIKARDYFEEHPESADALMSWEHVTDLATPEVLEQLRIWERGYLAGFGAGMEFAKVVDL